MAMLRNLSKYGQGPLDKLDPSKTKLFCHIQSDLKFRHSKTGVWERRKKRLLCFSFVQVAEIHQVLDQYLGEKYEIQCINDSKVRFSFHWLHTLGCLWIWDLWICLWSCKCMTWISDCWGVKMWCRLQRRRQILNLFYSNL